jgi:hypothetical protein
MAGFGTESCCDNDEDDDDADVVGAGGGGNGRGLPVRVPDLVERAEAAGGPEGPQVFEDGTATGSSESYARFEVAALEAVLKLLADAVLVTRI